MPIKTNHALAESVVFFSFPKKAVDYVHYFEHIDFCAIIDPECTMEQNKKRSVFENVVLKDGKIIWKFIFINKYIGFECHDYTRWDNFICTVKKLFLQFDEVVLNDICSIGLFVKDEFDVMVEKDFALSELFNKKSKFIVPIFFDTKYPPAMSVYKFYEHNVEHEKFSYSLGNEVKVLALSSENSLKFAIAHKQNSFFRDENISMEMLEVLTQMMHEKNKKYVSNILEKNVLKSIGMV